MAKQLTIEIPEGANIPEEISLNQEYLRYLLAGTLYAREILSEKEARAITGDNRREFLEKMARYGFCLMPESDRDIQLEINA